jgi:hypothetical protein
MTKQHLLIGFIVVAIVAAAGLALYYFLPYFKNEPVSQEQNVPNEVTSNQPAPVESQLVANDLKMILSSQTSGLSVQSIVSLRLFPKNTEVLYGTIFLPSNTVAESVSVTMTADASGDALGPIMAQVQNEDDTLFAVFTIKKPASDWPVGSYTVKVALAGGRSVTEKFIVQ